MSETNGREERDAWCRARQLGDLAAGFGPGEMMRCPAVRTLNNGELRTCGRPLGRAKPHTRSLVRRVTRFLAPLNLPGEERTCEGCRQMLEIYYAPATARLEATG